jgi:hypothetical protein
MKQWDVFLFPFPEELPHPVVIVLSDDRCVTSARRFGWTRPPKLNEVLLDQADGLDWTIAVRCIMPIPFCMRPGHSGTGYRQTDR